MLDLLLYTELLPAASRDLSAFSRNTLPGSGPSGCRLDRFSSFQLRPNSTTTVRKSARSSTRRRFTWMWMLAATSCCCCFVWVVCVLSGVFFFCVVGFLFFV